MAESKQAEVLTPAPQTGHEDDLEQGTSSGTSSGSSSKITPPPESTSGSLREMLHRLWQACSKDKYDQHEAVIILYGQASNNLQAFDNATMTENNIEKEEIRNQAMQDQAYRTLIAATISMVIAVITYERSDASYDGKTALLITVIGTLLPIAVSLLTFGRTLWTTFFNLNNRKLLSETQKSVALQAFSEDLSDIQACLRALKAGGSPRLQVNPKTGRVRVLPSSVRVSGK
jgi:hypothetical protein